MVDSDESFARERLGTVLDGRWTLDRLLGVGGMAAVYAATDLAGGHVAIKVLHPEMNRRADIRERFLHEGQTANQVDHPGVVRITEALNAEGTAILVMELLEGEPLSAVIAQNQGLPFDRLLDVLDQVLDVLAAAHERGIVHRDLKPDNLFVTREGRVKVLDFGIARVEDGSNRQHKTKTGVALGTVPYMAPEQALAKRDQIDGRTDLFSLGAMAFRIVAGRSVHVAESETEQLVAMATQPAPQLRSVAPHAPEHLAAVVDLALAFSRASRYPDARTMQADVRAVRAGQPPPHATRIRATREAPTNAERVAPIVVHSRSPGATVPTATAPTQPDDTLVDVAPTLPDVEDLSKANTAVAPRFSAPTVENPLFSAATVQMAASAPEPSRAVTVPMEVAASGETNRRRRTAPWIAAGVFLCGGAAGAVAWVASPNANVERARSDGNAAVPTRVVEPAKERGGAVREQAGVAPLPSAGAAASSSGEERTGPRQGSPAKAVFRESPSEAPASSETATNEQPSGDTPATSSTSSPERAPETPPRETPRVSASQAPAPAAPAPNAPAPVASSPPAAARPSAAPRRAHEPAKKPATEAPEPARDSRSKRDRSRKWRTRERRQR